MTTMISNLPRDLIEEILCKVPLKSMRAVHLTCKKWDTLSKSESFTKKRIDKAKEEAMMIVLKNSNLYLSNIVIDADPSIEARGILTCLDEQVKICQVCNCGGVLLCVLEDSSRILVWNPYSEQTRCIKSPFFHRTTHGEVLSYALGYVNKMNKSCPSYKILNFLNDFLTGNHFEIYDFDSDLWKTLHVGKNCQITPVRSVSLKGNTYWCAQPFRCKYGTNIHLICFDFSRERFGPLLPMPFRSDEHEYVTLSHVREEKLAVIRHRFESCANDVVEIWVTTKIEAEEVSWSKFLKVDMEWFTPTFGDFFIDEEKKVAVCLGYEKFTFIGESGYYRELDFGEPSHEKCSPSVCSYVPSLMQIK